MVECRQVISSLFLVPVGTGWGEAVYCSEPAKEQRLAGQWEARAVSDSKRAKLSPSLRDCFLPQHYPRSLVNTHIRPLCFQTCLRSQGRQQWISPSLTEPGLTLNTRPRMYHRSASWTKRVSSGSRTDMVYGGEHHPGPFRPH